MAGRVFYKAADGSMTQAGVARAYNAEQRRNKASVTFNENFGTAGGDTGEIAFGEADAEVKNGDYIATADKDGNLTRVKVTAANREELLNSRKGTMKRRGERSRSDVTREVELSRGTVKRYDSSKRKGATSGGAGRGKNKLTLPDNFNLLGKATQKRVLEGGRLITRKSIRNKNKRAASKIKTGKKNARFKAKRASDFKARVASNAKKREKLKNSKTPTGGTKVRKTSPATKAKAPATKAKAPATKTPAKNTGAGPKKRRTKTDTTATTSKKKTEKNKNPKNTGNKPKELSISEQYEQKRQKEREEDGGKR